jgi:hypothetical protein
MQSHLKNQPEPRRITLKKSHSVRETTPHFGKNKQTNKELNNASTTPIDSTMIHSILESHLKTINQTLNDVNSKLVLYDKRLALIEENMQHKRLSSISSSVSSISIDNENCFNTETISKLQKKIENLVARFDLIENDTKLIKQV